MHGVVASRKKANTWHVGCSGDASAARTRAALHSCVCFVWLWPFGVRSRETRSINAADMAADQTDTLVPPRAPRRNANGAYMSISMDHACPRISGYLERHIIAHIDDAFGINTHADLKRLAAGDNALNTFSSVRYSRLQRKIPLSHAALHKKLVRCSSVYPWRL